MMTKFLPRYPNAANLSILISVKVWSKLDHVLTNSLLMVITTLWYERKESVASFDGADGAPIYDQPLAS